MAAVKSPRLFPAVSNKAEILQKLEERAGPEARKLFEKFTRDLRKLQAQQEHDAGHAGITSGRRADLAG
jgi:hypothetical protein